MRKFYLFATLLSTLCFFAQGFNSSFAILNINGNNNYYCMYSNTSCGGNGSLDGQNLGTLNAASNTLTLKGAEFNVYKCSGQDINTLNLYYRIYPSGSPSGAFSSITASSLTIDNSNGCGGKDQRWIENSQSINLLSGLNNGVYTLEIYATANIYNGSWSTAYLSNFGNNYKVTFTVSGSLSVDNINIDNFKSFVSRGKLYTSKKGNVNVQVLDFSGRIIKTFNAKSTVNGIELNLPKKGNYILKVENEVVKFTY